MILRLIAITLIIGLLGGCERQRISYVSPEDYTNLSECWVDHLNNVRAFLIVAPDGDELIPYLISTNCRVLANDRDTTIMQHTNALRLAPDVALLSRPQWIGRPLISNYITDQTPNFRRAQIYAFNGRIELVSSPASNNFSIYKVSAINDLRRIPLSFEAFLEMSPEQLQQIYDRAISAETGPSTSTGERGPVN